MALLFIDGFECYDVATDLNRKWLLGTMGKYSLLPQGRDGYGQCVKILGPHYEDVTLTTTPLGNSDTLIIGFGFRNDNMPEKPFRIISFMDLNVSQLDVYFDPYTYLFSVRSDPTTILYEGSRVINSNTWVYVEIMVNFSSTGTFTQRINEVTDIDASLNTVQSLNGHNYANAVSFFKPGAYSTSYSIDDLYICDDTGSANNTFLGDMKVETLVPTGPGTNTNWLVHGTGANWQNVGKQLPTSLDYVYTAGIGDKDTYAFDGLVHITNSIAGVAVDVFCRNTDGAINNIKSVMTISGTDYDAPASNTINDVDYKCQQFISETNPSDSSAWVPAAINAAQYGMKLFS